MESKPTIGEIEALEREIREKQKKLNALRRQAGPRAPADGVFDAPDGTRVRLADLFGSHRDLIMVHNMGARCAYCTLWADGFNGMLPHFEDRAAFVVVSPDAPDAQQEFAARRGWRFRMVSDRGATFAVAMGYASDNDGTRHYLPGFSTFRRDDDGVVRRVAHASFGPGDPYCGLWPMIDLLDGGAGAWHPRLEY